MERSCARFRPRIDADLGRDWAQVGVGGGALAAGAIGGSGVDGLVVSLGPGYRGGALAHRAGHEGYRWFGRAWPDRFEISPLSRLPLTPRPAASEEWYLAAPLEAHKNPPSAPSAGDRVWRIRAERAEVGFLIRSKGLLRWEIRADQVVDGFVPEGPLSFEAHPWPLASDGAWYGSTGRRAG